MIKITFEESREWVEKNIPYGGVIFVSLPMKDRSEEEILDKMNSIHQKFMDVFDRPDVSMIDSYHKISLDDRISDNRKSVWYLGDSIKQMSAADLVIFAEDYVKGIGCVNEYRICSDYNIPFCFETLLTLID